MVNQGSAPSASAGGGTRTQDPVPVLAAFKRIRLSFNAQSAIFGPHGFTASVVHQGVGDGANQSYTIALEGKQANIAVCQRQYNNLWQVLACYQMIQVQMQCVHKRPHDRIQATPALWWKYAVEMTMYRRPARKSYWCWDRIKQHCARRRQYIKLCQELQAQTKKSAKKPANPELMAQLASMEAHFSAHRIVLYRQLARCDALWMQTARKAKFHQRLKNILVRRRSSAESSEQPAVSASFEHEYGELQHDLAEMLEQETVDSHEITHAELHVSTKINRVQLELKLEEKVICQIGIRGVTMTSSTGFLLTSTRFQSMVEAVDVFLPGSDGTLRHAVMNTGSGSDRTKIFADFCSADCLTSRSLMALVVEYGRQGPQRTSTPTVSSSAESSHSVPIRTTPMVAAYMLPVEVKLTRAGIQALHTFLRSPHQLTQQGSGAILSRFAEQDAEPWRPPTMEFLLSIGAPTVVIPAKDDSDPQTPCLIMNLGSHIVHGGYCSPNDNSRVGGIDDFEDDSGSQLSIESSGIQMLVTARSDDWREYQRRSQPDGHTRQHCSDAHVLGNTQCVVTVKEGARAGCLDVSAHVPCFRIMLSDSHVQQLARFAQPLALALGQRHPHTTRVAPRTQPLLRRRARLTVQLTCDEVCASFYHDRDTDSSSQAIELCVLGVNCSNASIHSAAPQSSLSAQGFYFALRPDMESAQLDVILHSSLKGSGPHARVRFDSRVLSPAHIIIAQLKEGNQKPVLTIQTARKKRAAFAHTDANIAGVQVCFCFPFVRPCARVCLRRPIQAAICAVFLALETRLFYSV